MIELKIYQMEGEKAGKFLFSNARWLEREGIRLDALPRELYRLVYDEEMPDIPGGLEDVFVIFNLHHPQGYRGRSLSVSDLVSVKGSASVADGLYFVDSIGFQKAAFEKEVPECPQ